DRGGRGADPRAGRADEARGRAAQARGARGAPEAALGRARVAVAIAARLRERGLSPKRRFGQNFLADPTAARAIAEAATTPPGGAAVEIGPGLGALTAPLLERAARVVAIELDRDLASILAEDFAPTVAEGRLSIITGDAL